MGGEPVTRASDLLQLPSVLTELAGSRAVERALGAQAVSSAILDNPLSLITFRDFCGIHEWAARIAGDDQFGLTLGKRYAMANLGPYGQYMLGLENVGAMISQMRRLLSIYLDIATIEFTFDEGRARFGFVMTIPPFPGRRHVGDHSICAMVGMIRAFAGPEWRPLWIEAQHYQGARHSALEDYFGVPVLYERPGNVLVFPMADLAIRNPTPRALRHRMTRRQLAYAMRAARARTLTEAVEAILADQLSHGEDGDIDHAARQLDIGLKALQSTLQGEGTSFRAALSRVRLQRAAYFLDETAAPMSDVAHSLGYADAAHFDRAFRHSTGRNPRGPRRRP
jgi:AraC-like DNA-binding protein